MPCALFLASEPLKGHFNFGIAQRCNQCMLLNTVTKQSENQEVNSYSLLLARWGAAKINKTSNMEKTIFSIKSNIGQDARHRHVIKSTNHFSWTLGPCLHYTGVIMSTWKILRLSMTCSHCHEEQNRNLSNTGDDKLSRSLRRSFTPLQNPIKLLKP